MEINDLLKEYREMVDNRIEELFPKCATAYGKVIEASR